MVFGIGADNDVLGYVAENQVGFSEGKLRTAGFIELVGPGNDVVPVDRRVDGSAIGALGGPVLAQAEVTEAGVGVIRGGRVVVGDGKVPDAVLVAVFEGVLIGDVHVAGGGDSCH